MVNLLALASACSFFNRAIDWRSPSSALAAAGPELLAAAAVPDPPAVAAEAASEPASSAAAAAELVQVAAVPAEAQAEGRPWRGRT